MHDRCAIIAEAGVNHNGSIELAYRLVDAAHAAGADIVKFQTFRADQIVTKAAHKAAYQTRTTGQGGSQYEMLKRLELPLPAFGDLAAYCTQVGIEFLSTPFDIESAHFLASIGVKCLKVPSGEITNVPFLRELGGLKLPVILSTGMATIGEVETALGTLENAGVSTRDISLLHCSTEYPAPVAGVNLRAMLTLGQAFPGTTIGYSDHTEGIAISVAAAALGARVLEKHLTLDKTMEGPDHIASLSPAEMTSMVAAVRMVGLALGDGRKQPSAAELANRIPARKSIIAAAPIRKGEPLTPEKLSIRRPGNGISPVYWDIVVGSMATQDYEEGDLIRAMLPSS
ncbi:N-acetylneuraminate synthase [Rhodopseudomonas palustris]